MAEPAPAERRAAPGTFPLFTGIRVFDRDYQNPRITSVNVGFEHELAPDWSVYVDFTYAKGAHLTRFLNYNVHGTAAGGRPAGQPRHDDLHRREPVRAAARRRVRDQQPGQGPLPRAARSACASASSNKYQLEANYVLSKDEDDDSNERDPFTDRSFNFYDLALDYGPSDRDIRHKFNFFTFAELPWRADGQRAHPGADRPADHHVAARAERRGSRPQLGPEGQRATSRSTGGCSGRSASASGPQIIPILEMFNTFNNANNINPLSTPALFNFDGFLRQGVGDPRQVQLAVKFTF